MSSAPSPLSLSDFLTSPPPLDLASLPPSSSMLSRYSASASQQGVSGSTQGAGGGTPSQQPHQQQHDSQGQDEAFLDFTLSPGDHALSTADAGVEGHDGSYGDDGSMWHQPPTHHQSTPSSGSQPPSASSYHAQPNGNPMLAGQQPDLRALLESLGGSADFDLDAASSPSSVTFPHALQQLPQQLIQQQLQMQQQQQQPGHSSAPNGLLDLLPQLHGLAQMSAGAGGQQAAANSLGQLQQHLQNQQQAAGGGQAPPDIASLLALLGVPAFAGANQQHGGHGQPPQQQQHGLGQDSAGATLAKLRELQEMQQAQAALIQQQLNQIASFYQTNNGQQQQPHSGSTTSTTSPSGASVQSGNYGQHQQFGGRSSGGHNGTPAESPHLGAQPQHPHQPGFQHHRAGGKFVGAGGMNIGPLPTPEHSGELGAMSFSPHLISAGNGVMSPVYLPGTSYAGGGSSNAATTSWRNTGDGYDRDGNLLMTPLISPAMTAISHPTPGSTFQPLNPALANAAGANGDFFSPLTSPALGPSQFERSMNLHQTPHSYMGTMSPHLLAQRSTPNSPLVNGSIGSSSSSSTTAGAKARSASRSARGTGAGADGGKGASSRAKTRPSPIIKPVVGSGHSRRRSTIGPSATAVAAAAAAGSPTSVMSPSGTFDSSTSQPPPPQVVFQGLPASAIPMEVSQSFNSVQTSVSPASSSASGLYANGNGANQPALGGTDSSPSPIDFASLQMPPPPHPSQQPSTLQQPGAPQQPGSVAPQTPATFLNLSRPAADQRAIYSEGNTVSPGLGSAEPGASTGTSNVDSNGTVVQSSYAAVREAMGNPPPTLSLPAGAATVAGGSSWQQPKQAVRIVEKSPLGSPALGPTDFDKGKGKEVADSASKGKKNGKAGSAVSMPAVTGVKRTAKGGKPPPAASSIPPAKPETKKTSHKAAEQKRRDSLKAGFDELRLLLPPINVELVDPDTGLPIAGASMPRLPARNLDTGEPNRNVSKVALLRCSNKHLKVLNGRIARRDEWIARLVDNIRQLRAATGLEGAFEGDDELFELDVDAVDREDEFGPVGPHPGEEADEGMADDLELAGLRRMSAEQEDGEGLDPVAEEGPEDELPLGQDDTQYAPADSDTKPIAPAPLPPSAPPAAVSLTRKKSLPKNAPPPALAARRPSTGRAAAMVASEKTHTADDDVGMDES